MSAAFGVPAAPGRLLLHHELAEPAHEKVLPSSKGLLANSEKLLHDRARLPLAQPHVVVDITDDLVFVRDILDLLPLVRKFRVPGSVRRPYMNDWRGLSRSF